MNRSLPLTLACLLGAMVGQAAPCSTRLRTTVGGYLSVDSNVEAASCERVLAGVAKLSPELRKGLLLLSVVRLERNPEPRPDTLLDRIVSSSERYAYHAPSHTLVITNGGAGSPGWRDGRVSASGAEQLAVRLGYRATGQSGAWCALAEAMGQAAVCAEPGHAEVLDALVKRGASSAADELREVLAQALVPRGGPRPEMVWRARVKAEAPGSDIRRFRSRLTGRSSSPESYAECAAGLLAGTPVCTDYENVVAAGLMGWRGEQSPPGLNARGVTGVLDRAGLDALFLLRRLERYVVPLFGQLRVHAALDRPDDYPNDASLDDHLEWKVGDGVGVVRPNPRHILDEVRTRGRALLGGLSSSAMQQRVQLAVAVSSGGPERLDALEAELRPVRSRTRSKNSPPEPNQDQAWSAVVYGWAALGHLERTRRAARELVGRWYATERRVHSALAGAMQLLNAARFSDAERLTSLASGWVERSKEVAPELRAAVAIFWAQLGRYDQALDLVARLERAHVAQAALARLELARLLAADGFRALAQQQLSQVHDSLAWNTVSESVATMAVAAFAGADRCEDAVGVVERRAYGDRPRLWAVAVRARAACMPTGVGEATRLWIQAETASLAWVNGDRHEALAVCDRVQRESPRHLRTLAGPRAIQRCAELWLKAGDEKKALSLSRAIRPYAVAGEELSAQAARAHLAEGRTAQARKLAWKVRCHPCRERLLAAIAAYKRPY